MLIKFMILSVFDCLVWEVVHYGTTSLPIKELRHSDSRTKKYPNQVVTQFVRLTYLKNCFRDSFFLCSSSFFFLIFFQDLYYLKAVR